MIKDLKRGFVLHFRVCSGFYTNRDRRVNQNITTYCIVIFELPQHVAQKSINLLTALASSLLSFQ
jgi:hypothetical protein